MKEEDKKKKPQLRRCAACGLPGHNKSTCPQYLEDNIVEPIKTARQPLKFFVHHVNFSNHVSPHVVDLKNKKNDVWENIEESAPEKSRAENQDLSLKNLDPRIQIKKEKQKETFKENKRLFRVKIEKKQFHQKFSSYFPIKKTLADASASMANFRNESRNNLATLKSNFFNSFLRFKEALMSQSRLKFILLSAAFVIILVLPIKASTFYKNLKNTTGQISTNGIAGFMSLQESTSALMQADLPTAEKSLENALNNFDQAVTVMQKKYQRLQKITSAIPVIKDEVQSRQKLITAGQKISLGNAYILKGIEESRAISDDSLSKRMEKLTLHMRAAIPNYKEALADLNGIKIEVLPVEYQATVSGFRTLFASFLNDLENIAGLGQTIQEIFGGEGMRRYLLVFQNPHELRPTGGFMGSFAILDIKDGRIDKLNIPAGGTYDLQGELKKYIKPPTPLLLSNKRWEFQDANWFPDFPASAEKILWFFRHSRNLTADGVIVINSSVLERLLAITGPIEDEKRNVVISSANAISTIQEIVEYGPEKKENKPKKILADLALKFSDYFQNIKPTELLPILGNLFEALENKEIQAYSTDEKAEKDIKNFGWGGDIIQTNGGQDYLFAVNTNIQGQKSDAEIKQKIFYQTEVQTDGSIIASAVVSKEHQGTKGEKLYGQTNIDYIRIYVPEGSDLLSVNGYSWPDEKNFRIPEDWYEEDGDLKKNEIEVKIDNQSGTRVTREFGKTAFGNWLITEPGQTSQIQFVYRLPFKIFDLSKDTESWKELFQSSQILANYQLIFQKQSGIDSEFESQIIFPDGWAPVWTEGENIRSAANGASIPSFTCAKNMIWSLIMKKE